MARTLTPPPAIVGLPKIDVRVTKEEEIAVLYALHCCGGRAPKAHVVELILRNHLLCARPGDDEIVATGEPRIANRIAWIRQNLKSKGHLAMPRHGMWQITTSGEKRLFEFAATVHEAAQGELKLLENNYYERLSANFVSRLRALGAQEAE